MLIAILLLRGTGQNRLYQLAGRGISSVYGVRSYRQSARQQCFQTLIELELDFKFVFDTFSKIDVDTEIYPFGQYGSKLTVSGFVKSDRQVSRSRSWREGL